MSFDLIIWDCDGCLVDSEALACGVAAERITALGYPLTGAEYINRFAGRSMRSAMEELSRETQEDYAERFDYLAFRDAVEQAFQLRLRAMPGVIEILPQLDVPMCIASGSSAKRIGFSLSIAKIDALKDVPRFSTASEDYAEGQPHPASKPAPDIFLMAAEQMGKNPARCLVIEDSAFGVMGGKAAGMTVFGFMGGSHVTANWRTRAQAAGPDLLFDDMRTLPGLYKNYQG